MEEIRKLRAPADGEGDVEQEQEERDIEGHGRGGGGVDCGGSFVVVVAVDFVVVGSDAVVAVFLLAGQVMLD